MRRSCCGRVCLLREHGQGKPSVSRLQKGCNRVGRLQQQEARRNVAVSFLRGPPWPRLLWRKEVGWEDEDWKQIFEVQTWRQLRGLAGAPMCETRDLGIKWPQWNTWLFEGQVAVYMRVVCPQDVKNMLVKQARMVYRKRWAAKHECEELKEGVWLARTNPGGAAKEDQRSVDRHRNVMRKLVVEDEYRKGCTTLVGQTKRSVRDVTKKKAQRSIACVTTRVASGKTSKKYWKWQRGMKSHPPSEGNWKKSHLTAPR